ncbi:ferric reduction oxidase 2-like isoform X2 [Euphorbia lathyris]|uniref:ferric reduction oxidase 2-like isoform X2 n=1 Tax=Euphorbia lathyris TaxID=212925 RepID=UPI00331333DA
MDSDSQIVKLPSSSSSSSSHILRVALLLLSITVLLGYFMLQIVIPTNTFWDTWYPSLSHHLRSSYFGYQGVPFLIVFFPLLFIAVIGCLYLHLGNTPVITKNGRKAKLGKPMLVKGPLGIVSGIELAFLIMFIALLTWTLTIYIRNSFSTITPERGEKVWEAKLQSVSFLVSLTGNLCLAFLFFPVTRGSSVLQLFGLTSEGTIKYHIWLGHLVMVFFTAHGVGYIVYWAITGQISQVLEWSKTRISNVAGEISLLAGLGLWVTTFPGIRQKMFELFFYTHHLYILFMLFFLLHISINFSTILMLPGFYLFLIDRYLRFLQSRSEIRVVSARILPCQTLELNFSKTPGLSYTPTSILFMNVPSISKLQWHPFTISSSSKLEPEILSVVIKSEGSWSSKLYQMLSSPSSSSIYHLQVSVEGPYGPASTHFLRHETLVMVSGGSGITPFISVIRELIHVSKIQRLKTPQIILICSFKNSSDLTMLQLLHPTSSGFQSNDLNLKIEAFVTRDHKEPTLDNSNSNPNLVRTICFNPHKTDAPISPVLGPKSWLWLGAIISSSFMIFLITIALINRYYIYPIDHNTNRIFNHSVKTCLYMLVMCVSIVITASAAVFWNKKQQEREAKQFQNNVEVLNNSEKELESLPLQSFVEPTNVHYGRRPDLKRMLFGCKGTSVGVLVCGPKEMRHEVATICSSGLAHNLHFESISFNW